MFVGLGGSSTGSQVQCCCCLEPDTVCEDPRILQHSAGALLFTTWSTSMFCEQEAGTDLLCLAEISLAAGLLASGGWNKNDS